MDGTGSESYWMAGFDTCVIELSRPAATALVFYTSHVGLH